MPLVETHGVLLDKALEGLFRVIPTENDHLKGAFREVFDDMSNGNLQRLIGLLAGLSPAPTAGKPKSKPRKS